MTCCMLAAGGASAASQNAAAAMVSGTVSLKRQLDVSGAVVWLEPIDSVALPVDGVVVLDQRGLDFDPHIVVVRVGTTVEFRNSDTVLHNIFAPELDGEAFDLGTWPTGQVRTHRFERTGVTVLLCNVHPEMEAFVVAVPGPWHALVEADGTFLIGDVPAGDYRLFAWHERGEATEVPITVIANQPLTLDLEVRGRS